MVGIHVDVYTSCCRSRILSLLFQTTSPKAAGEPRLATGWEHDVRGLHPLLVASIELRSTIYH